LPRTGSAWRRGGGGTANPGGKGHAWVKERFLGPAAAAEGRLFIEALVGDNPHVDAARIQHAYRNLSAVQQAQYLHGDWGVEPTGDLFAVDKIVPIPRVPATGVLARWRGWDKAGTDAEAKRAKYAKYTAGARLSRVDPRQYGVEWVIEDLVRGQWSAGARETRIRYVAKGDVEPLAQVTHAVGTFDATRPDPPGTVVLLEQEGGSGGKESAEASIRNLARVDARLYLPSGDKEARARPLAAQMEAGNVGMVIGPWNEQVRQVLRAAPKGVYWDEIDALSMIFNAMAALPTVPPPLAVSTTPDWAALGFRPL
jgi:predicted phage terminase large subunit-like protein